MGIKPEELRVEIKNWYRSYLSLLEEFPHVRGVVRFIGQGISQGPEQDLRDLALNDFFGLCGGSTSDYFISLGDETTDKFHHIDELVKTMQQIDALDPQWLA